jgi:type II secretory pathway component PulM
MAFIRKRRVEQTGPATYALRLQPEERATIGHLLPQLRQLLTEAEVTDPRIRRLFPTTYTTDPEAEAEYQRLMRDDLVQSRLSALDIVETGLEKTSLSEGDLLRWMQAINDARLVLGTMLDVSEEDDRYDMDEDHPDFEAFLLFNYLGGLLDDIVSALSPG